MRFIFGQERCRLRLETEGEVQTDSGDAAIMFAEIRAGFQQDSMFVVQQLREETESERLRHEAARETARETVETIARRPARR